MTLLQISFLGAVMIFAIVVVRALTVNKLPKKTFMALWGVAAVRLLIPYSLPSAFSVYSLPGHLSSMGEAVNDSPAVSFTPMTAAHNVTPMAAAADTAAAMADPWVVVWMAGALACAAFFAVTYLKCRREFKASLPVDNEYAKLWPNEHRIYRTIEIRQSGRISAPLTYGIFRPVILMPKTTDWDDPDMLKYVLTHEYVHIRRFDAVTKLILTVTLCIHWFNPAVWVMYVLANRDIELSCDETVVHRLGERTKSAYATALIRMEETRSGPAPLCNNFSKNAIEERIIAIMKMRKTSLAALTAATVLVVGMTAAFATSAKTDENLSRRDSDHVPDTVMQGSGILSYVDPQDGKTYYSLDGEDDFCSLSSGSADIGPEIYEGDATADDFLPYESYGLTWDEGEKALFWNGQRVRYFLDGVDLDGMGAMAVRLEYLDAAFEGGIDVHTVRQRVQNADGSFDPMGPLTGLEKYSQAEYDFHTVLATAALEAETYMLQEIAEESEKTQAVLQPYTPFGLSYRMNPVTGELSMSWQGKPVHSVFDAIQGVWIANSMRGLYLGPDAVDLETVYEQGKLIGLQETQHQPITQTAFTLEGGSETEPGTSFAELFEKYDPFGITYVETEGASGAGNVYYNGQLVSQFADLTPNGGAFTFSSAEQGGIPVKTVYDNNGRLTGVEAI